MADDIQNPNLEAEFQKALNPANQAPLPEVPQAEPAQVAAPTPDTQVNVVDPEGQLVSIPSSYLSKAMDSGYTQATPEQVKNYAQQQKYGSLGQQALSGLEAAGQGATFGLSTGIERAMGVKPEDIRGRAEANPGTHAVGEITGLAGSALIPGGEANILKAAGEAGAEALGLTAAESIGSKIGSGVAKGVIENALFQSGDEVGKFIAQDPNQSTETAITDIGLSGLIGGSVGGALGSVSPLWKATQGAKVGGVLKALADKAGGIEGVVPDVVRDAIQTSGMDIAPEIKASLSSDPEIQHMFQTLQESSTNTGLKTQEALKTFKNQAGNAVISALGKTPEEVAALEHMSEYEIGENLKKSLVGQLETQIDPISEKFSQVKERFKSTELPQTVKDDMATKIAEMAKENGYNLSPSSPQAKAVGRVLEELPNLKTLEDVRKYGSVVADNTNNPELWRLGGQMKRILRGAEESVVDEALGAEAPELLSQHAEARAAYKDAMGTIDNLNDRLHVGRYSGPGSFISALKEMAPEDVLRRLSPKGDAGIIGELSSKFPEAAEQIKDFHLSQSLKNAASRAAPGETINTKAFLTSIGKMSPEMRNFIVPEASKAKIDAISHLLEAIPSKMNNSGTGKTLDSLWNYIPGSAAGLATLLTGHSAAASVLVGGLAKILSRDAPDAIRLSLLKFLGSNQPIESEGFKAMVDFVQHTIKGENLVSKAAKNVFNATKEVLPQSFMPTESDRKKLDKQLKSLQTDPSPLLNVGGATAHYLPDHGTAIGQVSATAVNYLNSQRPNTDKKSPLDRERDPSPLEKARYDRALNIAQQPLVLLDKIQKGTLTSHDVVALRSMYPNLYARLNQKLSEQMIESANKGVNIPYKTRLGLSLFLGQPLDSTMTPSAITSAQMTQAQVQSPQQQAQEEGGKTAKHSMSALNKLPGMYQTPSQARIANKERGH